MASVEQYSVLRTDIRNRHSDLAGAFDDDLCLEIADELKHTGTIFSSTINLCNTILGSGMLAMVGFTSAVGLYLLARCAEKVPGRKSSFFAVAGLTYPKAALLFDFAIALKCFGVSVSYLIIFGDLFPQVVLFFGVPPDSIVASRSLWITAALIGMVPLAFKKQLDSLKYVSFVALVAVVYLLYSVTDYYFDKEHRPQVPNPATLLFNCCKAAVAFFVVSAYPLQCHPARASIGRMIAGFQSPKQETSILMSPSSYSELADQPTLVSSPQSLENGTAFYGRLSENNTPNSSTSIRHDLDNGAELEPYFGIRWFYRVDFDLFYLAWTVVLQAQ
ncbi:Vacuolar amino acid transporter 5 [Zancudomyces culisetae]|uniref:Vacuolar amino acid transporter 5 n=1 Tax=Zancudomyces culisetae TaxID=1213189 RepID=A0A1R1PCX8_ZANCU|nr:Vacuolar amino acid transporter 5 [Zancudomyces culisetae]|eukprot:OMH78825.1 Vacuolar amino acid transporter 5 [Zancudomyces culisetae]